MRVRLLVPRRADGGHRDRVWDFCRAYWQEQRPGWQIAEGEDTQGTFNRSAALNRAAEGRWDVGVILDADTILDADLVERGIARATESGRLTLPFKIRCLLDGRGTERILAGARGGWERFVAHRQMPTDAYEYISGAQIVPRALWEEVGGFDERFCGWGGEDDAFHAACMALAGQDPRADRLDGCAWHLWHERSPHADHRSATWIAAKALSDRYIAAAEDWNQMRALLAEDRGADQVVVVILTTGKRPTLADTVASIDERVSGPIGRRLILVDADATDVAFGGWELLAALDRLAEVVWDRGAGEWDTGRRALLAFDPASSHHLVVQDDAIVCRDLIAGAKRAAVAAREAPLGLYCGQLDASPPSFASLAARCHAEGSPWFRATGPHWGVAVVIPTAHLPDLIAAMDGRADVPNYDARIAKWYRNAGIEALYPIPSLVDHRPGPSLYPHRRPDRRAYQFVGTAASALDVDWSAQPIAATAEQRYRHRRSGRERSVATDSERHRRLAASRQWESS